jgi:hypothetical protein
MEREKWLHADADEGRIKLPNRPRRSLNLNGKRIKMIQLVAAALLFCYIFSLSFEVTPFFARHRNWIEHAGAGVGHDGDEMICNFNEVCSSPCGGRTFSQPSSAEPSNTIPTLMLMIPNLPLDHPFREAKMAPMLQCSPMRPTDSTNGLQPTLERLRRQPQGSHRSGHDPRSQPHQDGKVLSCATTDQSRRPRWRRSTFRTWDR